MIRGPLGRSPTVSNPPSKPKLACIGRLLPIIFTLSLAVIFFHDLTSRDSQSYVIIDIAMTNLA
jgi:hypothetical protein